MSDGRWRFAVDAGGTFTDCIGLDPEGRRHVCKVLSGADGVARGIRTLLGLDEREPIPPCEIRFGTTVATNALLEGAGARCAVLTNRGLGDLLAIGDQTRDELFSLEIVPRPRLHERAVEIDARLDANGAAIMAVDEPRVRASLEQLRRDGIESVAIVLLHAHRDGAHERRVAEIAQEVGFEHVGASHDVAPAIGMLSRGDTTVVDAYVSPPLRAAVDALGATLSEARRCWAMQSTGGLVEAARFRGRDAVLSGPAGGVVAVAGVARSTGARAALGFDMGGTSTDVCRWAGEFERTTETTIAGARLRVPMLEVHTVAAGGGSVCQLVDERLTVGPRSVGSDPGPLCYGRPDAHELALTDVNLALGRVIDERFALALADDAPERVRDALDTTVAALAERGVIRSREAVAAGFLDVANETMANAIAEVSVARGHDVREHALVVFGGAGGQHACAIADRLGIRRLLLHPLAGVLSAHGIATAPVVHVVERDLGGVAFSGIEGVAPAIAALERVAVQAVREQGAPDVEIERHLELQYAGTTTTLAVPADADALRHFDQAHGRAFGYTRPTAEVLVRAARVEARGTLPTFSAGAEPGGRSERSRTSPAAAPRRHRMWTGSKFEDVPLVLRSDLGAGEPLDGPALILEDTGTIVVERGWTARVLGTDAILEVVRSDLAPERSTRAELETRPDPVALELFLGRFATIAAEMGAVLQRTAQSTNIRDRLDFSCAVFDAVGNLVTNAPHIPVHLGAMSETVRAFVDGRPTPEPGLVVATNDPAAGGSHLPDITVITSVHDEAGVLRFFVACRGHHADVGGTSPGSMPPDSTHLDHEGVVLRELVLVRDGRWQDERIAEALSAGPYPARRPAEVTADLRAQVAANRRGVDRLRELLRLEGAERTSRYMGWIQDNAETRVREAISRLDDGVLEHDDALDDGTRIHARIEISGDHMRIDFTRSSDRHVGNLNAPRAVTVAAVIYVLRCLVGEEIPLNSGCLRAVDLDIRPGSLLDPPPGAAVAAGNVETSQRVVDVLLGALGRAAASQGTMNNLSFGDERFGYYETLAGGAGGTPFAAGASTVHTHMTNTRMTDPERLEAGYPVRVVATSVRRGSGGAGRNAGGDGLVRELEFLAPLRVSMISERRARAPFGLAGGEDGFSGRNTLDGAPLRGRFSVDVRAGQRLRIETPGGGGWGPAGDEDG